MEETQTKTYAREIMQAEMTAASTLSGMVMGNLQAGNMPPTDVFKWFAEFVAYHLCQVELDQLADSSKAEELEPLVLSYVQALDFVFSIASKNKMLVLEEDIRGILKARKLHLPVHFDSTYGGVLP